MTDAFPTLVDWVGTPDPSERERFLQYWHAVDYHLRLADEARAKALDYLRDLHWAMAGPRAVLVYPWNFDSLINYGDISIREAASVLDMGLQLVASIVGGIEKKDVHWGRGTDEGKLRRTLKTRTSPEADRLVEITDAIYGSIGYELLKGYRDWVTHRGAPRLISLHDERVPLELSEEVANETDRQRLEFFIRRDLSSIVGNLLEVHCYPFVPPVQAAVEHLEIEAAGATVATIKHARIALGNLSEDARVFRRNNPTLLEG